MLGGGVYIITKAVDFSIRFSIWRPSEPHIPVHFKSNFIYPELHPAPTTWAKSNNLNIKIFIINIGI